MKPQAYKSIASLLLGVVPDSSQMEIGKPVETISIYPSILGVKLITISKLNSEEDRVGAPKSLEEQMAKYVVLKTYL